MCYAQRYTHDAQCVTYNEGPDADYHGKEICFAFNGTLKGCISNYMLCCSHIT